MRKLLVCWSVSLLVCLVAFCAQVFVIGCAKKLPPQQFVLQGIVRLDGEVKEGARVKLEVCRHTKWYENKKLWETTTDKWGRYQIIVGIDWFKEYYRVLASAYDKFGNFHKSDWQYGVVHYGNDQKDFWLGSKKVEEGKRKRRRRF